MTSSRLLPTACMALMLSSVIILNGCPGSNVYKSDSELFRKFLLDPIPESVTGLRVNRPKSSSDPVHVMHFKINNGDVRAILKANPFVERSDWELDVRRGILSWSYSYAIRDAVDETMILEQGNRGDAIPLDKDANGRFMPNWFRPDQWDKVRFYAYIEDTNPKNRNHLAHHVLMYNEELSEAYYLRSQNGGL